MRGKVISFPSVALCAGITPAHAGKSTPLQRYSSKSEDHPRTCGEKLTKNPNMVMLPGSPPHMRGKVL